MKWSTVAACAVLVFRLSAIGQVKPDGTIIVITASEKELVIASDGRRFDPNFYSDDVCKISTLSDKIVFTVSGRAGPKVKPNFQFWNAFTVARQQFQRLSAKGTSDTLPFELAQAWGVAIKKEIEKRMKRGVDVVRGLTDHAILSGIVAGIKSDGSIIAISEAITFEPLNRTGAIRIVATPPYILKPTDFPWWMGKGDIIKELVQRRTFRSDQWNRNIEAAVNSSSDPIATRAIEEVRLTIENLEPTMTDSRGVRFSAVGLPISALRLSSKGLEWIQKGNCPQN
jgi:hypothetical protein